MLRHEADEAERAGMRKIAAAKKKAKSMMPREEDVRHWVDHWLSSFVVELASNIVSLSQRLNLVGATEVR